MRRFVLTLTTSLGLCGAFQLYTAVVAPLVRIERLPVDIPVSKAPETNTVFADAARRYLPDQHWAQTARVQWRREDSWFLFSQNGLPEAPEPGAEARPQEALRFSPLAIIWKDPEQPGEAPYVLVADSATVQFENSVQIGESRPGRMIAGTLNGNVRLTGPGGLFVEGRDFTFRESADGDSRSDGFLYSDRPIAFRFGPSGSKQTTVRGTANQLQVALIPSDDPELGRDMPHISGPRTLKLRRDVDLTITAVEKDGPQQTRITSDGSLEYDFETQRVSLRDNVLLIRQGDADPASDDRDSLWCERLLLQLMAADDQKPADESSVPADSPDDGERRRDFRKLFGADRKLTIQRVRAEGDRVAFHSKENDITANMQLLDYDVEKRLLALVDDRFVDLERGRDKLRCAGITFSHDENEDIQSGRCEGVGNITRVEPLTGRVEFEAYWTRGLTFEPDSTTGMHLLTIAGRARFVQRAKGMGIVADTIAAVIDSEVLRSHEDDRPADVLPVHKITATEDVALDSPQAYAETDLLEIELHLGKVTKTDEEGSLNPLTGADDPDGTNPAGQVLVRSDRIQLDAIHDVSAERFDVRSGVLEGGLKIAREDRPEAGQHNRPFLVEAGQLHIDRAAPDNEVYVLTGSPAILRDPETRVGSDRLEIHRQDEHARIVGPGSIRRLVHRGLDGRELEHPAPLDVSWKESMTVAGREVRFLGSVSTMLQGNEMRCEDMVLTLSAPFDLSESDDREKIEIDLLHCRHEVLFVGREWEETTAVGIREARMAELTVNLQDGTFSASGPGWIDDWSRGRNSRSLIVPVASASANSPLDDEADQWEFTRIEFDGSLKGNHRHRTASLHERVEIIHGPVDHARERIERDDFSLRPEATSQAVWLGSNQLSLRLFDGADDRQPQVQMEASGNAELEGATFQAWAHRISFDQAKELFTLRGRGEDQATIWHQSAAGEQYSETAAQMIQCIPSKRWLWFDGNTGFWGVR